MSRSSAGAERVTTTGGFVGRTRPAWYRTPRSQSRLATHCSASTRSNASVYSTAERQTRPHTHSHGSPEPVVRSTLLALRQINSKVLAIVTDPSPT